MFCHDGTTIFYPTAPGRVYMITIAALADCNGSDADLSDSTRVGNLGHMLGRHNGHALVDVACGAPPAWPDVYVEDDDGIGKYPDLETTDCDFHDAIEQWADWCDRDSARLDSLDGVLAAVAAA